MRHGGGQRLPCGGKRSVHRQRGRPDAAHAGAPMATGFPFASEPVAVACVVCPTVRTGDATATEIGRALRKKVEDLFPDERF